MRTIEKMMMAAALLSVCAATGSAQGYSQPVREVEKEARMAVSGGCDAAINMAGQELACQLAQVPAGKILAIRWLSVNCQGPSTMSFVLGRAWAGSPATNEVFFPLQQVPSPAGRTNVVASSEVFMNGKSGAGVFFQAAITQGFPGSSCSARFQGFLIDN